MYAHHRYSDSSLTFPTSLPLLFSSSNTAQDIQQTFANILRTTLLPDDLHFLFVLIENEKISFLHWMQDFLELDTQIPDIIHADSLHPKQNKPEPKLYSRHEETKNLNENTILQTQIKSKPSINSNYLLNSDPAICRHTIRPTRFRLDSNSTAYSLNKSQP